MKISQIDLIAGILFLLDEKSPGLKLNARQMNAVIRAGTEIMQALNTPNIDADEGMGLQAWLASDDTGASSLYMAHVMFGTAFIHPAYPLDPADFGRCYRLLRAVPGSKGKLKAMSTTMPEWAVLVAHWNRLENLYEIELPMGNAPKLYEMMQGLYAGIVEGGK